MYFLFFFSSTFDIFFLLFFSSPLLASFPYMLGLHFLPTLKLFKHSQSQKQSEKKKFWFGFVEQEHLIEK